MASQIKKEIKLEIGHVLFMDIVGYSKLLINEQRARRETLTQIVRETEAFREADGTGTLIKSPTGDGMALVFRGSPEEPVECALEISRNLKSHPEIPLRIGVHSGPVTAVTDVNDTTSVAGAGINLAQRVMDCGDASHILISKHVAEDLDQFAHWQPYLHDLGECEAKHGVRVHLFNLYADELGNPRLPKKLEVQRKRRAHARWTAMAIGLACLGVVGAVFFFFSERSRTSEKSIAVLPFENLSRDPDNAYFVEGIQDEILTRLSKIADLKVISRTSTQRYRSAPENLPEIGRQLGVAQILEGSVQKSADSVRVNVQLIKASNDSHLWADTLDRKLVDIFVAETEIAKSIADQLRAKLSGQEQQLIAAKATENPEAYDAYLRGLAYTFRALNATNYVSAQKYLREAVRLDPKFALAWARLSQINSRGYLTTNLPRTDALREETLEAAEIALRLQPDLGEALLAKGEYYYGCLKDYDAAERYFEQARQFLPNSSQIPESLAYLERRRGHWDRTLTYFEEAERLDPKNISTLTQHAASYVLLRRFPEALRRFDQILDIVPDDVDILITKAGIAQAEGDLPRAAALLAPLRPPVDDTTALETQVYQAILERRSAKVIPQLKEILAKSDSITGYSRGELGFWLGWAQDVSGDSASAQKSWRTARGELELALREQPDNLAVLVDVALTNMGLGDKTAAFSLTDRALAANPIETDAMDGPVPIEVIARVSARLGEPDRAIASLQQLLSIPCEGALASSIVGRPITAALLRLDPMFDPIRNDPRFEKLAHSDGK